MANRTITIDVNLRDNTKGKVDGLKKSLEAIEKVAERANQRLRAIGLQRFAATLRLIDQVTAPASRINNLLKSIAGGAYRITMRINDGALAGIKKIESALLRITSKAYPIMLNVKGAAANKLNGLLSGAMMGAGVFAPVAGMAGVGFGVANAVSAAAGFERQMSKVQAIRQLDKNSPEMKALTQQAKDLGMQTAWTRQQVGEAQYYQALAGWSTKDILATTPHLLNLASASGTGLGRTSDIVTDTMTAFNLKPTDTYIDKYGKEVNVAQHYIDLLAKLQASSNTTVEQAAGAMKYSANLFGVMSSNLQGQERIQKAMDVARDAAVMTGLLANAGIKESMSGTGMSNIMQRMTSGNRNAYRGLELAGVKVEDAQHNILPPEQIIKQLNKAYHQGIDTNVLADFVEQMSGEKIHADTRRKLDKLTHDMLENGGKMGTANMMQLGTMLGGAEHAHKLMALIAGDWDAMEEKLTDVDGTAGKMASDMLDNLAGSFTKLGSAWDAFQQDLFTGTAGDGLRNFVDALTEMVTRANKLFSDGIDIPDLGKILGDVIGRLKNKFLEFDGIGSLLAGGALVMGLTKIINLARSAMNVLKGVQTAGLASTMAGRSSAGALAAQKVGTMTVSAGVVNIAGKVNGSVGGGGVGGAGGRKIGNAAIIDNYNKTKERIRGAGVPPVPPAAPSRFAGFGSAAGGAAAFAGIFSLLDIMNVRAMGQERLAAATTPEERTQIIKENRQAEWQASGGALGSIVGAAIGAGLGSFAGPLGTAIGGVVGGMLGDAIGRFFGDKAGKNEKPPQSNPDYFGFNDSSNNVPTPSSWADFRREQETQAQAMHVSVADFRKANEEATRIMNERNQAMQTQMTRFQKIDEKLGVYSPFRFGGGTVEAPEIYQSKMNVGSKDFEFKMPDMSGLFDKSLGNALTTLVPSLLPFTLWENKASAAELSPEQMAQQAAMEQGQTVTMPTIEMPETNPIDEWFNFDGVGERLAELGAQITEGLYTAFEGASETVSEFGAMINENLSVAMEGAGEIFNGIGEQISAALTSAGEAANSALSTIQSAFQSAKDSIEAAWSELPGFFSGVFSGLGGAASAAGSAIYAGLTSVIGSIIGAWQSAAATISGIISSIGAAASGAVAGASAAVSSALGIGAHAEGGFVTSPEIALIGERSPEAIIPLDGSKHAFDLYRETGKILGVSEDFSDNPISNSNDSNGNSSGGITVNLGGFNVEVRADSAQEFMASMRENIKEVSDQIAMQLAETIGGVHKNQPLSA